MAAIRHIEDPVPRLWMKATVVAYLLIAWWLIVEKGWSNPHESLETQTPFFYLLSAQAETIGAIFALTVTIMFVVVQTTTNYGRLLFRNVISSWAVWYIVLFIVAIVLPLFLLNGKFWLVGAQISLLLGGLSILALAPFIYLLRQSLDVRYHIQLLRAGEDVPLSDQRTGVVLSIVEIAASQNDTATLVAALEALGNVRVENSAELSERYVGLVRATSSEVVAIELISAAVSTLSRGADANHDQIRDWSALVVDFVESNRIVSLSEQLKNAIEQLRTIRLTSDSTAHARLEELRWLGAMLRLAAVNNTYDTYTEWVSDLYEFEQDKFQLLDEAEEEFADIDSSELTQVLRAIANLWKSQIVIVAGSVGQSTQAEVIVRDIMAHIVSVTTKLLEVNYHDAYLSLSALEGAVEVIDSMALNSVVQDSLRDLRDLGDSYERLADDLSDQDSDRGIVSDLGNRLMKLSGSQTR